MEATNAVTFHDLAKASCLPLSFAESHIAVRDHLGDGVFALASDELGVVYEIEGIFDEVLSDEELASNLDHLLKFIRVIALGIPSHENPQNIVVQVICSQRKAENPNTSYGDDVFGRLLKREEGKLFGLGLVKRRFFIAIRYAPKRPRPSIRRRVEDVFSFLSDEAKLLQEERQRFENDKVHFLSVLGPLEDELRLKFEVQRLNPADLIEYLQSVLFCGNPGEPSFVREGDIHKCIHNPIMGEAGDGLILEDGRKIKCYVLAQHPEKYALGRLRHFMDSIPIRSWDLAWCFSHGNARMSQGLAMKASWFNHGEAHRAKFEDIVSFTGNISGMKPHGIQSLRLITHDASDSDESVIQTMGLDLLGSRLVPERQITAHIIATSMPLCLSREQHSIAGRSHPIRLENARGFWPVYDGPTSKDGTRWRCSRYLTPTRLDLFKGSGNKMTTVIGNSRSGKSVEINQLIMEFLSRYPHGLVRTIDRNTSYTKLADLVGGKVVSFSESELKANPYSPFALNDWDEEDIDALYVLIATAIMQTNPDVRLTALHTEILRDAIKIAYNNQFQSVKYANKDNSAVDPHPIWTNILAALPVAANVRFESGISEADSVREDLAKWTVCLGETGQYGFLFCKHEEMATATHTAKFLVYDLGGGQDKILQLLAGQMSFMKIRRDLAKHSRATPKLIILEEYGMFVFGKGSVQEINAEFSQLMVKTSAKLNAQLIAIDNSVGTFADNEAGRSFWNIALQRLFLPMTTAMIDELTSKLGGISDAEIQIIRSLEMDRKRKRSEMFVKSENSDAPYHGSVFLPLSPEMDAIVTTDGPQEEKYRQLRHDGMSAEQALRQLAEKFPFGDGL